MFGMWYAGGGVRPAEPAVDRRARSTHVLDQVAPSRGGHRRAGDSGVGATGRRRRRMHGLRRPERTCRRTIPTSRWCSSPRARPAGPSRCCCATRGFSSCSSRDAAEAARRGQRPSARARKAPMPNLIPTSMSLWAGIYNVLFAFRVGRGGHPDGAVHARAFADAGARASDALDRAAAGGDDHAVDDPTSIDLAPLKYVRSITAPLSPLQARRFRDKFGVTVLNCYGQTEIGGEIVGWNAADAASGARTSSARSAARTRASPCERSTRRHEVAGDEPGELFVQTPALTRRLRRRRRVRRPADCRRLVPHRRHGPGRPEGFLWIEGRRLGHDQPRRAEGVSR